MDVPKLEGGCRSSVAAGGEVEVEKKAAVAVKAAFHG